MNRTFRTFFATLAVLLATMVSTGCAGKPKFVVQVDALADPSATVAGRYVLLPGAQGIQPNDLQFREFKAIAQKALAARGYQSAADEAHADFAIFMNYGISGPQTQAYQYSVPIYGQFYGGTSVYSERRRGPDGRLQTRSGTVYNSPQWGVVGTDVRTGYETRFMKFARLDAVQFPRDAAPSTQPVDEARDPLWSITMTSLGASGDLRETFPYLIAAGMQYLGSNTGRQVTVTLRPGDPQAESLRP